VPYHKTILVVEDDPNDQTFILEAFRSIGVEAPIQVLSSGSEAIAYLKGEGKYSDRDQYAFPSFIMTDLDMVRGNGFFLLKNLHANPDWAIIPKVVLSGSKNPADIKQAYTLGASCYHVKPGSQAELCEQLQLLHDYWMTCEVPELDAASTQTQSGSVPRPVQKFTHMRAGHKAKQSGQRVAPTRMRASGR
jgi:CheY-like chemotaxis protein